MSGSRSWVSAAGGCAPGCTSQLPAYDPRLHNANFLVAGAPAGGAGYAPEYIPVPVARRTFGPPARVYHFHGYTVMVWDVNLLTRLGR